MIFKRFERLYHTVRPLRREQILYRLRYKLFPIRLARFDCEFDCANWIWNGPESQAPSMLRVDQVSFLNRTEEIPTSECWNSAKFEKLWLYNLHYFDDLNALENCVRIEWHQKLVRRWIKENPPMVGNGWEPYPISLRLVNWIKWYQRASVDDSEIISSVAQQAEALSKQLEYHILGNHLFANAKALVFAGCFLKGKHASRYLALGINILNRELPEQFKSDGGHFELSPMYHCILLWDLLDLINLATISGEAAVQGAVIVWREYANRALQWLAVMIHPDREISFFNDCALGIAAKPEQIFAYAEQLGLSRPQTDSSKLITLRASNYSRINMSAYSLFFDHAAVGPDYLPGHAHADTLSVELSIGDERVLVNSGTSVYGASQERLRQRKTVAHNTVMVNQEDSSEVWGGFRVARRAYAKLETSNERHETVQLAASHDGYMRLDPSVVHRREIVARATKLTITDSLSGMYKEAAALYHLHPDVTVVQVSPQKILLILKSGKQITCNASTSFKVTDSSWHPRFGVSIASKRIVVEFCREAVEVSFHLG